MKVLLCVMNAKGSQCLGGIFTLQYIILKMTVLLHKKALVIFPMATSVYGDTSPPECIRKFTVGSSEMVNLLVIALLTYLPFQIPTNSLGLH